MMHLRAAVVAFGLALGASALPAQQTWIVDPSGTGNFTDLQVAINTAASGDTLLLRGGGHYVGNYTWAKHLALVGEPPQRPRIDYVDLPLAPASSARIMAVDLGSVNSSVPFSLEDVTLDACYVNRTFASLHRCTVAHLVPSALVSGLRVTAGEVVVTDSTLYGGRAFAWQTLFCHVLGGPPAVAVTDGEIWLSDSTLVGAPPQMVSCSGGLQLAPASAAISLNGASGATAWITRSSVTAGSGAAAMAISSGSSFYYDVWTQFSPAQTAGTQRFQPATQAQGAPPGGAIICTAATLPGQPAAMAASLGHHPASSFPGISGSAFIDPGAFVVLGIGFADIFGELSATIPLPATAPRGLSITVQAASTSPAGVLQAAIPVTVHVL